MSPGEPKFVTRQTLILKVKNQYDEASWKDFTDYYGAYIYAIFQKLGVNPSDIADLQQTALLSLWKSLPNFDYDPEKGRFRSWLSQIVRRNAYAYFKTKSDKEYIDEPTVDSEIEKIAEREWKLHIAKLAWSNVKNEFSESVQHIFTALTQGEAPDRIAEQTGVSRGTVYVYKERVQNALRREVRRLDRELG